jgi:hypothetical protein
MEDAPEVAVLRLRLGGQAVQQVALGHQAEKPPGAVHHRQAGRPALDHRLGHRMQRGIGGYGGHLRGHYIARAHRSAPDSGSIPGLTHENP